MSRYDDIAKRWIDHAIDPSVRLIQRGQSHHNSRLFPGPSGSFADRFGGQADAIFSYGTHFEIARVLRNGRGKVRGVLVNGERASVTTTKHQNTVRSAIRSAGVDSVIVPYGALEAAGVDLNTVRPLEVTADRTEYTRHDVPDFDPNEQPVSDTGDSELQAKLADAWRLAERWADTDLESGSYRHNADIFRHRWQFFAAHRTEKFASGIRRVTCLRGHCGACDGWQFEGCEHLSRPRYYTAKEHGLEQDSRGWYYTTGRHWMGESLIMADVKTEVRVRCSACAGTGAEQDAERYGERARILANGDCVYPALPNRSYGSAYACRDCAGGGTVRRTKTRRNVRFLSGFDHAERTPSYFFCELPASSRATTIGQAYADLKPDAVRLAEQIGRTVQRQGDIFAIATTASGRDLRATARAVGKRSTNDARVLGTNHCATEVAFMEDGTVYARGCLYHVPDGRRNDHARVKLSDGKTWFLLVKNTVPVHQIVNGGRNARR